MFPLSPSRRLAALAAAVLVGTTISGCSASQSDTPTPSGTSTAVASAAPSESAATSGSSDAGAQAPNAAEALPAALFEEGGMTLEEYARQNPDSDYVDVEQESVLEERVGRGTQEITVDAQKGAVLRIVLLCPSDATGKTDIHVSSGDGDEKTWMAGSEALCGGWSAATPPIEQAGPVTFTVTVDNDEPYRVALTVPSE